MNEESQTTGRQRLYNETDNKHPRGIIGMMIANQLIERGWYEDTVGLDEHFWISPTGKMVGKLEWAYEKEFGRRL